MSFNLQKFTQSAFRPREDAIDVPALKAFFDADEKPVWTVRGLTAAELARANEARDRNRNLAALAQALASNDKAQAIKDALGCSDNVPDDVARRQAMLAAGSVAPEIEHDAAVLLSEAFPVEFYNLTNKILELTGEGAEVGKKRRSTPATT